MRHSSYRGSNRTFGGGASFALQPREVFRPSDEHGRCLASRRPEIVQARFRSNAQLRGGAHAGPGVCISHFQSREISQTALVSRVGAGRCALAWPQVRCTAGPVQLRVPPPSSPGRTLDTDMADRPKSSRVLPNTDRSERPRACRPVPPSPPPHSPTPCQTVSQASL